MYTTQLTLNHDRHIWTSIKWTALFFVLILCITSIINLHNNQIQKLEAQSEILNQKSFLVSKMHEDMLSISRMQLQILHARNEQQVKNNLRQLSELISTQLFNYYQLKNIANESDTDLLVRFKSAFEKWHDFNENLLSYANVISDIDFINTLNKVDMAFSQFDQNDDAGLLLISQLK